MGIFDDQAADLFTTYQARIEFRDKIMGGVPKDPKIIEGWLRSKAKIDDVEEVRRALLRTLVELGAEVTADMSYAELEAASVQLAATKNTNGFKVDPIGGLYLESRTIKSMIKECVNILFAGDRWGKTKKGPRGFTAERVFINPDRVALDRQEPDGIELFIGHTSGPKGPQSNLTYHEYVTRAVIHFAVMVAHDEVPLDAWPQIWVHAQENGLGALRSQGFGRFDIQQWEPIKRGRVGLVKSAVDKPILAAVS